MKKIFALLMACLLVFSTSGIVHADSSDYTDGELNMIANTVNGEVGGLCGTILLTYFDDSYEYVDGTRIRNIHAKIIDNQVKSDLFPDDLYSCIAQCWSTNYLGTTWGDSYQWKRARENAIDALDNCENVPNNLFAATCDPRFSEKYPPFMLWARVDWDTGWYSGTFYYYSYGYPVYEENTEEVEEEFILWTIKKGFDKRTYLTE